MRVVASRGESRRSPTTAWNAVDLSETTDDVLTSAPCSVEVVRIAAPTAAGRSGDRAGCLGELDRSVLKDTEAGAGAAAWREASACKRSFRRRASEDVRTGGCTQTHVTNRLGHILQCASRRTQCLGLDGRTCAIALCCEGLTARLGRQAGAPSADGAEPCRSSQNATRSSVSLSESSSSACARCDAHL